MASDPQAPRPVVFPGSGGAPYPQLVTLVRACSAEFPPDVLMFGDSVMLRWAYGDQDRRLLGEMLRASLPATSVEVSQPALNPQLMHAFVAVLSRLRRPKVAVMPVNLRCFSPQWDFHPAWTLQSELDAVAAWLADPSTPIRPIEDVEETPGFYDEYDRAPARSDLSALTTVGQFRQLAEQEPADPEQRRQHLKELFVHHYGHALKPQHRKLTALVSAATLARELGIRPVAYALPVNIEAGEAVAGPRFRERVAQNAAVIGRALEAAGVEFRDHSQALPASAFFHPQSATEHLNEQGRKALCEMIVSTLRGGST